MHRIMKIEERLLSLPKIEVEQVIIPELDSGDLLIVAAGFEDRALEALTRATRNGKSGFEVLIIDYLPVIGSNKLKNLVSICEHGSIRHFVTIYDRRAPAGIGDKVIRQINPELKRIFIDISAMSRLLIVQLISAFGLSDFGLGKVTVLYSEAMKYPPDESFYRKEILKKSENGYYRALFLSWGVYEVISVPELSSVSFPGQLTRLVAFPSFNSDQLSAIWAEIQPNYVSLIHGRPPLQENAWRLEAIKEINCENLPHSDQCEDFCTSTLDYYETFKVFLGIYAKYSLLDKIVIAPTGSKMQSVAIGIIKCFFEDVQVIYPITRNFASPGEYTEGVRNLYQLPLNGFKINTSLFA